MVSFRDTFRVRSGIVLDTGLDLDLDLGIGLEIGSKLRLLLLSSIRLLTALSVALSANGMHGVTTLRMASNF